VNVCIATITDKTARLAEKIINKSNAKLITSAILSNAKTILLSHNHPSGSDVTPSEEDISITKRLIDAGKIMGIDILDHIIIGENGKYYSFKEEGRL